MRPLEAQIAEVLDEIVPTRPQPEGWESILAAAHAPSQGDGKPRSFRGRALTSRGRLITAASLAVAIVAAVAVVGASLIGSTTRTASSSRTGTVPQLRAQRAHPHGLVTSRVATPVRTLVAYTHVVRARRESDLPPDVAAFINRAAERTGAAVTNVQEPIVGDAAAGTPSVYLVMIGTNLCTAIALHGATMSCGDALRQASGSLDAESAIVDGKMFIYGLAANDVSSITVTLASTARTPGTTVQAQIANNVFVAPLPYDGGPDIGGATVTVTRSDGTTGTVTLPGLSCPICGQAPTGSTTTTTRG